MPPGRRRVNLREVARQGREGTLRALRAECVGRTPRACDRAGPPCLVPEVGAFTGELPTRHRAERGWQRDGLRLLFPGRLQLRTIPRPEGRPSAQRGQASRGQPSPGLCASAAHSPGLVRPAGQCRGPRPPVGRAEGPPPLVPHCLQSGRDRAKVEVMACWGPWPGSPVLCPQLRTVWWEARPSAPPWTAGGGS